MDRGYKILLPDDVISEIKAEFSKESSGELVYDKFQTILRVFKKDKLRQYAGAEKTFEYYLKNEIPSNRTIKKALNIGKTKEHGVFCKKDDDKTLLNLLCFFTYRIDWESLLEKRGLDEKTLIIPAQPSKTQPNKEKTEPAKIEDNKAQSFDALQEDVLKIKSHVEEIGQQIHQISSDIEDAVDTKSLNGDSDSLHGGKETLWQRIFGKSKQRKSPEQNTAAGYDKKVTLKVTLLNPNIFSISEVHYNTKKIGHIRRINCWFKFEVYTKKPITIKGVCFLEKDLTYNVLNDKTIKFIPVKKLTLDKEGPLFEEPFEFPVRIAPNTLFMFYLFMEVPINVAPELQHLIYESHKEHIERLDDYPIMLNKVDESERFIEFLKEKYEKEKEYIIATEGYSYGTPVSLGVTTRLPVQGKDSSRLPYSMHFGSLSKDFLRDAFYVMNDKSKWETMTLKPDAIPYTINLLMADDTRVSFTMHNSRYPFWFCASLII